MGVTRAPRPDGGAPLSWADLRARIVGCDRCPRLVAYRAVSDRQRPRAFTGAEYWARPVPGFGDPAARLLVVGLAPSAHGANRTGRMFTGDRSARFLVAGLHRAGYASQPTSDARGDGLRYADLFLSAAARCAPPDNRPTAEELGRCRPFLVDEIRRLGRLRAILCLGGVAWDATLAAAAEAFAIDRPRTPFAHGAVAALGPSRPIVYGCYHPSPQNTQTGRFTPGMLDELLRTVRSGYEGSVELRAATD